MARIEVAVATRDPKALYNTVRLLKALKLGFNVCNPGDSQCEVAKVVITTEDEAWGTEDSRIVKIGSEPDTDVTAIEVRIRLLGIIRPSVIAIGVDPGMRFGLAMIADGNSVHTKTVSSPIEAARHTLTWLHHIRQEYPDSETVLRIGTGSPLYSALYLRGVIDKAVGSVIELVDEHHTTIAGGAISDQSSAVIIASRHGRTPSSSDIVLEPKEGDVKALKLLFVRLTDGRSSLTTNEARLVLAGSLSLEKLVDESN